MTTTNLSDFGYRELAMLEDLLQSMRTQGLPADFDDNTITPVMNRHSGNVFLSNSEYQAAMLNGGNLESFYTLSYSGEEGFAGELYEEFQRGNIDENDYEQLAGILDANGMTSEADEIRAKLEEGDDYILFNEIGL